MKAGGPLSRIRVVLLRPSHPGNIGAAARAMKTMGITQLRLVRPKRFPHPEARAMASGALDVLESARACASLEEALAGTTYSVALSARARGLSHSLLDARGAARPARRTREEGVRDPRGDRETLCASRAQPVRERLSAPAAPSQAHGSLAAPLREGAAGDRGGQHSAGHARGLGRRG